MIIHAAIMLDDQPLLIASVRTAFDSTSIEVGNAMRQAILDASQRERLDPRFDQFLLATAASDWARSVFAADRDAGAVVPCSMGRPCRTIDTAREEPGPPDPTEPRMVLSATVEDDVTRMEVARATILSTRPTMTA